MKFAARIWLVAVVMSVCCLTTLWVRAGFQFDVAPLQRSLASIPVSLDDWQGSDITLEDDSVFALLNAQETIDRAYEDSIGRSVQLTISAWLKPETVSDAAPHLPKLCYQNAGWSILQEQAVQVDTTAGAIPLQVMLMERGEERMVAGYWYQMGSRCFTTVGQARQLHREFWGQPRWPATVKVLMQTPARTLESGLNVIERMTATLQRELASVVGTDHPGQGD